MSNIANTLYERVSAKIKRTMQKNYSPAERDARVDELTWLLELLDSYRELKRPRLK